MWLVHLSFRRSGKAVDEASSLRTNERQVSGEEKRICPKEREGVTGQPEDAEK